MSLPIILMIIGIVTLLISIFMSTKQSSHDEIEQISINLHQETNHLKRRVKALEEELMMDSPPLIQQPTSQKLKKPVHTIIVSQITALHDQGYSIEEISKRSTLPPDQVLSVLQSKGVRV